LSKVIRGEEVKDCQAWHVPDVQNKGAQRSRPMTASQVEEIQNQARKEGFQQGRQEGHDKGYKEFLERIQCLEQIMRTLNKPLEELDEAVEGQLVQLAMVVARQLVRRELATEPEQVIGVVREALAVLPLAARNVSLTVNPLDADLIREGLSLQQSGNNFQIVEDPVMTRGGCRVLTEASRIDATVESRLNAVIANVLGGQRSTDS
jgi:flagellar assembly protein FliH